MEGSAPTAQMLNKVNEQVITHLVHGTITVITQEEKVLINGFMKFQPSEDVYMGQFDSGLKHGIGKYTYLSGGGSAHHPYSIPYYAGEWFADSYHGLGKHLITQFEELMIYEGTHTHDKKNGFGRSRKFTRYFKRKRWFWFYW